MDYVLQYVCAQLKKAEEGEKGVNALFRPRGLKTFIEKGIAEKVVEEGKVDEEKSEENKAEKALARAVLNLNDPVERTMMVAEVGGESKSADVEGKTRCRNYVYQRAYERYGFEVVHVDAGTGRTLIELDLNHARDALKDRQEKDWDNHVVAVAVKDTIPDAAQPLINQLMTMCTTDKYSQKNIGSMCRFDQTEEDTRKDIKGAVLLFMGEDIKEEETLPKTITATSAKKFNAIAEKAEFIAVLRNTSLNEAGVLVTDTKSTSAKAGVPTDGDEEYSSTTRLPFLMKHVVDGLAARGLTPEQYVAGIELQLYCRNSAVAGERLPRVYGEVGKKVKDKVAEATERIRPLGGSHAMTKTYKFLSDETVLDRLATIDPEVRAELAAGRGRAGQSAARQDTLPVETGGNDEDDMEFGNGGNDEDDSYIGEGEEEDDVPFVEGEPDSNRWRSLFPPSPDDYLQVTKDYKEKILRYKVRLEDATFDFDGDVKEFFLQYQDFLKGTPPPCVGEHQKSAVDERRRRQRERQGEAPSDVLSRAVDERRRRRRRRRRQRERQGREEQKEDVSQSEGNNSSGGRRRRQGQVGQAPSGVQGNPSPTIAPRDVEGNNVSDNEASQSSVDRSQSEASSDSESESGRGEGQRDVQRNSSTIAERDEQQSYYVDSYGAYRASRHFLFGEVLMVGSDEDRKKWEDNIGRYDEEDANVKIDPGLNGTYSLVATDEIEANHILRLEED